MEFKFLVIFAAVALMCMVVGVNYPTYAQNQCKLEYSKSNRTADEILKICKR